MKFLNTLGETEIGVQSIKIRDYPFEPASVFPQKEIYADQMEAIHLKQSPPTIKINSELIFISKESAPQLAAFAERNQIILSERAANWDLITEPFLDTEFDETQQQATLKLLQQQGFTENEITALREEIGRQMHKYNFNTMLWEWGVLGLHDVLSAMRPKLNKAAFREFYWRAMEIEQRTGADPIPRMGRIT